MCYKSKFRVIKPNFAFYVEYQITDLNFEFSGYVIACNEYFIKDFENRNI